jgi:S1-C subfamily serine protease
MIARLPLRQTPGPVARAAPGPPFVAGPRIEQRIEAARASVVSVLPAARHGDGSPHPSPRAALRGLGVVVDPGGYILTTDRVARQAGPLEIELADGRKLPVAVLARDPLNALAVLKVNAPALPALALGHSGALSAGDIVGTVGPRTGPAGWATRIVSTGAATGGNLVTDTRGAAVHGGPLINLRGEVVGILTDGRADAMTAAVPIDRAMRILNDLKASRPATSAHRADVGASDR